MVIADSEDPSYSVVEIQSGEKSDRGDNRSSRQQHLPEEEQE